MFQDGSNRRPTDWPRTQSASAGAAPDVEAPRSASTVQTVLTSRSGTKTRAARASREGTAGTKVPRSDGGPTPPDGCNTDPARGQLPSGQGLVTASRTGRGSRRGGKCTRRRRPRTGQGPWSGIPKPGAPPSGELNSASRLLRAHSFASKWFHVLLNSLFKVLFNFPSRYLFAIGLVQVFSLRWSLPPALGCIPKQPDSEDAQRAAAARHQRPDTRHG